MYSITGNCGYHDIVIHNNTINSAKFGLQIAGIATNKATNIEVSDNIIGDMSLVIAQYAISMSYTDNVRITGNELIGAAQGMAVGPVTAGIYINAGCTNTKIRKNIIHDFNQTGTAFPMNGAEGIVYLAEATSLTEITDNLIYNIKSPGQSTSVTGANPFGIFLQSGGNIKIQHNTIYMGGNYLSSTVSGMSACIGMANNITQLDIRDNILKNSSQPVSGTPASKSYCITTGTNPGFTFLGNNDYFCDGIGARIGYYGGADKITLADWQAATGMDANTVNVDPVFTGSTNFVPTTTAMPKAGVYIPTLPTDLANVTRTNPPDIGAYEFTSMPVVVTTAAGDVTSNSATVNGTINPNATDVNLYFDYGTTTAYGTTVNGTPYLVNGSVLLNINAPLTGLTANTTYHFRIRAVTFGGINIYGNDMTFTTTPGIPENLTVGGEIGGGLTPCYNASNTITVGGPGNPFTLLSGSSATFIAWQKISYLPGTQIQPGSYMHGYISPGTFCVAPLMPATVSGTGENTPTGLDLASFSIFPNPTNGNFTLVQKGENLRGNVKIEVFTVRGDKVMTESMIGEKQHEFNSSDLKAGLYFVKVVADGYVETMKLVKL
jgi:hypothetical protein